MDIETILLPILDILLSITSFIEDLPLPAKIVLGIFLLEELSSHFRLLRKLFSGIGRVISRLFSFVSTIILAPLWFIKELFGLLADKIQDDDDDDEEETVQNSRYKQTSTTDGTANVSPQRVIQLLTTASNNLSAMEKELESRMSYYEKRNLRPETDSEKAYLIDLQSGIEELTKSVIFLTDLLHKKGYEYDGYQWRMRSANASSDYRQSSSSSQQSSYSQNTYSEQRTYKEETRQESPAQSAADTYQLYFNGCQTADQIKTRYRDLAKIFHPDSKNGSAEAFNLLTEAYEAALKNAAG